MSLAARTIAALASLPSTCSGLTAVVSNTNGGAFGLRVQAREKTAHATLHAKSLELFLQDNTPLLEWANTAPYLRDPIPGQNGPNSLTLVFGPKRPATFRLETHLAQGLQTRYSYIAGKIDAKLQNLHTLMDLCAAIQGPYHAWTTHNTSHQSTTFKAPDDTPTILLLDRLMRAPAAVLSGAETTPKTALSSIMRHQPIAQDPQFPPHLSALLPVKACT